MTELDTRVRRIKSELEADFKSGQLPEFAYVKGLVQLAYDLAVGGEAVNAYHLLIEVEPEKFTTILADTMSKDPTLYAQGLALYEILKREGLTPELAANMKAASA